LTPREGLTAAVFAAADFAVAALRAGGKQGKPDLGFDTVVGNSDDRRSFFLSILEYVSNLFNKFSMPCRNQ
jgi:hypothetical protein